MKGNLRKARPCPGCGSMEFSTELCPSCRSLLALGKAALAKRAQEGITFYRTSSREEPWHFWWSGGPDHRTEVEGARYRMARALGDLARLIAEPVNETTHEWHPASAPLVEGDTRASYDGWPVYMHHARRDALNALHKAILAACQGYYAAGKAEGSNLLVRLAANEITVTELVTATVAGKP